jgi:putative ABC transport system permease protein
MERELDEELRFHLEREMEQNRARGMDAGEARRAALVSFGGVERVKEECRDVRGGRWIDTVRQDLRYGFRLLWQKPGFTVMAVLALALGIGANTAIFSVVNGVLLRPLPYAQPDRLALIWTAATDNRTQEGSSSYPDIADWRAENHVFEDVASFRGIGFNLTGVGEPERIDGAYVSANFFSLLRVSPRLGRSFRPEEDRPGGERVVLLSHGLWQRRFGGDPKIVGQILTLNGQGFNVVGVLPPDFSFPFAIQKAELWSTIALEAGNLQERGARTTAVLARLKPGITPAQAQADLDTISERLAVQSSDTNATRRAYLVELQEQLVGKIRPALWVLLGAVGFVLLIGCSNVANLLLARAAARQKEIAIRLALGASRGRVVRQLLTESALLAALACIVGLLLAAWVLDLLIALGPSDLPNLNAIQIDGRVLGFTLLVSLATALIFGLAPALKATRPELTGTLKDGGRGATAGPGRQRLRGLLVVSEMALALILLISAGLLLKSFRRLTNVQPGFDPANVLSLRFSLPQNKYKEDFQRIAFVEQVLERVRALPGVKSAAFVTPAPFSGNNLSSNFSIVGRPAPPPDKEPLAWLRGATPDYFRTLGIPLIKGRQFTERDQKGGTGVAIINEALARRYWPDQDPIGQRLTKVGVGVDDNEPTEWEIVGVVGDVHHIGLDVEPKPELYVPHRQQAWGWGHLVVRTASDPLGLANTIRQQVQAVDSQQAVSNVEPLTHAIAGTVARPRFYMLLLGIFAAVGLTLTVIGIYGVLSYAVTERTHEIGIRMALGAQTTDILRLVLRQGMAFALGGIVIGLTGAFAATRVLASLLYGVNASDPATFLNVSLLAAFVALVACYIPARRATRVDSMHALRYE